MKGVIVQIGEPKSIVLYNNGKIGAIPTPVNCHVGMELSVKYNNKLKIIALTLAAGLLVALGVFIGALLQKDKIAVLSPPPEAQAVLPRRMMMGRGHMYQGATVHEAKNLPDDSLVLLTGSIVQSLGDEKHTFRDATGDITVEIDRKIWRDLSVGASDTVEISGEVDIEKGQVKIDVKSVRTRTPAPR